MVLLFCRLVISKIITKSCIFTEHHLLRIQYAVKHSLHHEQTSSRA